MRKFFSAALIISLIISALGGANAQSAGQRRAPASKTGAVKTSAKPKAPSAVIEDELVAMLPATDVIAVLDIGRAFNELLPKLTSLTIGGVDKLAKSIQDFTLKTGVDPSRIQKVVIGVGMDNSQGSGVVLIHGIDPDSTQIEAVMKEFGSEFKTSDYKGITVYNVLSKAKGPSAGPFSLKTDDLALAALGRQRVAFGDMKAVRQVVDVQTGAAKGGVSVAMKGALNETRSSALVRFALVVPETLRAEAANQGDLFKSVSAIKMILGTFDVAGDFGLSLDAVIRTASQNDATELENGLKGLIGLGRDIFGSGDPKTNLIAQLLDQVKIGSKVNEVALSISLPREILDQLTKKETPTPAEKK
jgi:hypothetical protein